MGNVFDCGTTGTITLSRHLYADIATHTSKSIQMICIRSRSKLCHDVNTNMIAVMHVEIARVHSLGRYALCRMPRAAFRMSHVACRMSHVVCRMSHVACRLSLVACSMSHVTCHMSHVPCRMSPVACTPSICELCHLLCFPNPIGLSTASQSGTQTLKPDSQSWARSLLHYNRNRIIASDGIHRTSAETSTTDNAA